MAKASKAADDTFEGSDTNVMVDLSEVQAASFEVLPRGTYSGVISNCEFQYSQNAGKPMWALQLTVSEGEYEGRKLFTHMSFSEKALPMTKKSLAIVAPEFLSKEFNPEAEASEMEGKSVRFKVTIQKYQGEDRNRVNDFVPLEDAAGFM